MSRPGQAERDRKNSTEAKEDRQNRAGKAEQDRQTGQEELDMRNRIGRTRLPEQG
jgi:hypothetical protein